MKSFHDMQCSGRDFMENAETLRHGFYSLKFSVTEKVKEIESVVKTLEGSWNNQRLELLSDIKELNEGLSKIKETINQMQNGLSSSLETIRTEISKSMQVTEDHCTAEVKKSETSVNEKLAAMDESIDNIRNKISLYSDFTDYWLLVFRLRPGNYGRVFEAWLDGEGARESLGPDDADVMFQNYIPFRNYAVDFWERLRISLVRVALFDEDGREVAFLLFDGAGSDKMNWFSKERLLDSSWGQLRYDSAVNYFSIAADSGNLRRFFINVRYGGCENDHGFLVVLGGDAPRPCNYEKRLGKSTQILYSMYPGGTRWSSEFREAAYMDISIYSNTRGFLRSYRDITKPL